MNRSCWLAATVLLSLVAVGPASLGADDLTAETYIDFTLAHLKLIAEHWEEEGEAPAPAEEEALFQKHGIAPDAYYAFAGDHAQEIEGYLEAHSDIRKAIDELSSRIRRFIEQTEKE